MRSTILICFLSLFTRCHKEPAPAPIQYGLEGKWRQVIPSSPKWQYSFHQNLLTQSITDFGVTITSLTYPYAEISDTIYIGGNATNDPRTWTFRFMGNGAMYVRQLPFSDPGLSLTCILERIE